MASAADEEAKGMQEAAGGMPASKKLVAAAHWLKDIITGHPQAAGVHCAYWDTPGSL